MGPLLCVQHTMSLKEILPFAIQLLVWLSSTKTTLFIPSTVKQQGCSHDNSLLHSWLKGRPWRRGSGGTEQDLPQTPLLTDLGVFIAWPGGLCSTAQPSNTGNPQTGIALALSHSVLSGTQIQASFSLTFFCFAFLQKPNVLIKQSVQVPWEITQIAKGTEGTAATSDTKSHSWTCTSSKTCKIYRHYWASAENTAEVISPGWSKLIVLWHWWKIFLQGHMTPEVPGFLEEEENVCNIHIQP